MFQLAGSFKGRKIRSIFRGTKGANLDAKDDVNYRKNSDVSNVELEADFCPRWDAGTCTKGEKCRFRHRAVIHKQLSGSTVGVIWSLLFQLFKPSSNDEYLKKEGRFEDPAISGEREYTFYGLGKKRREEVIRKKDQPRNAERCEMENEEWDPAYSQPSNATKNAAATEQYIVLESNFVTCGPGLQIRRVIPGYDLCQIILHLPVDSTRADVEAILSYEKLTTSDFRILKVERGGEAMQVVVVTPAVFGDQIINAAHNGRSRDQWPRFEVRYDAIWTSGTMMGSNPSLKVVWGFQDVNIGGLFCHALSRVYDSIFNTKGARMETCCLLSTPDQISLTVAFDNWDTAEEAAKGIASQHSVVVPSLRCSAARLHSFHIPLVQYEAQKGQWKYLSDTRDKNTRFEIRVLEEEVIIQLEGDRASIGPLKVRAESLIRGEVLEGPYWHPSFALPEESARFLGKVSKLAVVHLQCHPGTKALVVYGESERINEARRMIQREVHKREQVMTKTAIMDDSLGFFMRGGYQRLQDLFGADEVDLRITPRWSAIIMRGGEEATHHLRRLIRESKNETEVQTATQESAICSVCFSEVIHPEQLECGHTYCSGCLNRFLKAAADNKKFPIVCMGDRANCKVSISLPFMRHFLPQQTFKGLVEAAFASYLEKNATEFQYCRTADCRQTYRRRTVGMSTCPSCFAKNCFCQEGHDDNMTCEEYRVYHDPVEQERLNNSFATSKGYRRCPHCNVWVEKTGGCDHMFCRCKLAFEWTLA